MPRPDNVGVGVAVVIFLFDPANGSDILLLKRKGAHAEGTWACPGGWIDFEDSSPEDTCVRELKEELGLDANKNDLRLLTAVSENHEDLGAKSVTLYYTVDAGNLTGWQPSLLREPDKASEFGWFSVYQLPTPLFPNLWNVVNEKIR